MIRAFIIRPGETLYIVDLRTDAVADALRDHLGATPDLRLLPVLAGRIDRPVAIGLRPDGIQPTPESLDKTQAEWADEQRARGDVRLHLNPEATRIARRGGVMGAGHLVFGSAALVGMERAPVGPWQRTWRPAGLTDAQVDAIIDLRYSRTVDRPA